MLHAEECSRQERPKDVTSHPKSGLGGLSISSNGPCRWALLLFVVGLLGCSDSGSTGPRDLLEPGLYVLVSIDGKGSPFATTKTSYGETLVTSEIAFDSVFVTSDTSYLRVVEVDVYSQSPGEPPVQVGSTYRKQPGSILWRSGDLVLAPTPNGGFDVGEPGYFHLGPRLLRARIQTSEASCSANGLTCASRSIRLVDAVYALH
jgi:hypothetical protein